MTQYFIHAVHNILKAIKILSLPQAKLFEILKSMSTLDRVTEESCNDTQEVMIVAKSYGEIKWLNQCESSVNLYRCNLSIIVYLLMIYTV
jgi:hypothetical protein